MRHPRTLAELKADPRIVEVWRERDGCFSSDGLSYWVELAPGFLWEECSCLHEATVADLCAALRDVYREER